MGLPGPIFRVALALFALSVVGALGCLGIFFWYDTDFWGVFEVGGVAKVATVSLSGLAISDLLRAAVPPPQPPGVLHDLRGDRLSGLLRHLPSQPALNLAPAALRLRSFPYHGPQSARLPEGGPLEWASTLPLQCDS